MNTYTYEAIKTAGKKAKLAAQITLKKQQNEITLNERHRCTMAIKAQIEIIRDRINYTKNETLRQGWAIAAIELTELLQTIENPLGETLANKKI